MHLRRIRKTPTPVRCANWRPWSVLPIVASTILSVAAVALVDRPSEHARAIALRLGTALIWLVLDGLAPFARRMARNAVSPQAFFVVATVLCVSWNITGVGLDPVQAVVAVALAALIGGFTVAIARRAGFLRHGERVLVVGSGVVADALVAALEREARSDVVGRIDDGPDSTLLGDLDAFERVAVDHEVSAVIFAYSYASDRHLAQLAARSRELGLAVAIVPRLFEQFDQRLRTRNVAGVPVMTVEPARIPGIRSFPGTHIGHRRGCGSPRAHCADLDRSRDCHFYRAARERFFYRAERVGLGGRHFKMFKFRKMRRDASGSKLTLAGDPRFTRVGSMLARTKLDELPQLLNVLIGRWDSSALVPGPVVRRALPSRVRGDPACATRDHGSIANSVPRRVGPDLWEMTTTSCTGTPCSRARSLSTDTTQSAVAWPLICGSSCGRSLRLSPALA